MGWGWTGLRSSKLPICPMQTLGLHNGFLHSCIEPDLLLGVPKAQPNAHSVGQAGTSKGSHTLCSAKVRTVYVASSTVSSRVT